MSAVSPFALTTGGESPGAEPLRLEDSNPLNPLPPVVVSENKTEKKISCQNFVLRPQFVLSFCDHSKDCCETLPVAVSDTEGSVRASELSIQSVGDGYDKSYYQDPNAHIRAYARGLPSIVTDAMHRAYKPWTVRSVLRDFDVALGSGTKYVLFHNLPHDMDVLCKQYEAEEKSKDGKGREGDSTPANVMFGDSLVFLRYALNTVSSGPSNYGTESIAHSLGCHLKASHVARNDTHYLRFIMRCLVQWLSYLTPLINMEMIRECRSKYGRLSKVPVGSEPFAKISKETTDLETLLSFAHSDHLTKSGVLDSARSIDPSILSSLVRCMGIDACDPERSRVPGLAFWNPFSWHYTRHLAKLKVLMCRPLIQDEEFPVIVSSKGTHLHYPTCSAIKGSKHTKTVNLIEESHVFCQKCCYVPIDRTKDRALYTWASYFDNDNNITPIRVRNVKSTMGSEIPPFTDYEETFANPVSGK